MQLDKMMLSHVLLRTWRKIKDMDRFVHFKLLSRSSEREDSKMVWNDTLKNCEVTCPSSIPNLLVPQATVNLGTHLGSAETSSNQCLSLP